MTTKLPPKPLIDARLKPLLEVCLRSGVTQCRLHALVGDSNIDSNSFCLIVSKAEVLEQAALALLTDVLGVKDKHTSEMFHAIFAKWDQPL